jgi:hypothetical protein
MPALTGHVSNAPVAHRSRRQHMSLIDRPRQSLQ